MGFEEVELEVHYSSFVVTIQCIVDISLRPKLVSISILQYRCASYFVTATQSAEQFLVRLRSAAL